MGMCDAVAIEDSIWHWRHWMRHSDGAA